MVWLLVKAADFITNLQPIDTYNEKRSASKIEADRLLVFRFRKVYSFVIACEFIKDFEMFIKIAITG